jgi:dolichyl-phosphate beta-glucosyltransferase
VTELTVVIPCFNEESRLPQSDLLEWAKRRPDWCWLLVDDGSSDGTAALLRRLESQGSNLRCLVLPRNGGKAEAIRQGLLQAPSSKWYAYLDADFAASPRELERIYERYKDSDYLFVLGSRLSRLGARIERTYLRHYLGRVAATCISLLLKLPTYDTQCGLKVIHGSLIDKLLGAPFLSRWLFDVELLARCRNHLGLESVLRRVIEEPLSEWQERSGSKLRPRDFVRFPLDLWRIHRRYNLSSD